jgi:hypothetical protein
VTEVCGGRSLTTEGLEHTLQKNKNNPKLFKKKKKNSYLVATAADITADCTSAAVPRIAVAAAAACSDIAVVAVATAVFVFVVGR